MLVKEVSGYSKAKAHETAGVDVELDMMKNATQAWKKAGSPIKTKDLNAFMAGYLKEKKVQGAYLVVEAASDDTRLRPYSVINEVTKGKRKTTTFYQVIEAELKVKTKTTTNEEGEQVETHEVEVLDLGPVATKAERKDTAMKAMKELIENNKRNYAIKIVKEVTDGQPYAGYGIYTPSKSAKQGKFMFFVNE
jgi:hypothetical protein